MTLKLEDPKRSGGAAPLVLQVGKTYVTKLGSKYLCCATGRKRVYNDIVYPCLCLNEDNTAIWFLDNGQCYGHVPSAMDLISEFKEPDYRWFRIISCPNGVKRTSELEVSKKELLLNTGRYNDPYQIGIYKIDMNTGAIQKEE